MELQARVGRDIIDGYVCISYHPDMEWIASN